MPSPKITKRKRPKSTVKSAAISNVMKELRRAVWASNYTDVLRGGTDIEKAEFRGLINGIGIAHHVLYANIHEGTEEGDYDYEYEKDMEGSTHMHWDMWRHEQPRSMFVSKAAYKKLEALLAIRGPE